MEARLRQVLFGSFALLAGITFGQAPYTLMVDGEVAGCNGNTTVTVQTLPGTLPAQAVSVPVDANCFFHASLGLTSATGGVFAYSVCGNGTATADSSQFSFDGSATDSAVVALTLFCGSDTIDECQACVTVAQVTPFTAQFASCSSGGAPPYTCIWLLPNGTISMDASPVFTFSQPGAYGICMQISDATGCSSVACDTVFVGDDGTINPQATAACQAGFWTLQAYEDTSNGGGMVAPIAHEVWVWNLSIPNSGTEQFAWDFGDGASSSEAYPTHVYDGPGPWQVCLTLTTGNCTDSFCDSVSVDANGYLNGMAVNHHEAAPDLRDGGFTLNVLESVPTGIPELPAFGNFRLWPNPVQNELNISFTGLHGGTLPVEVIDRTGRTVIAKDFPLGIGANTLQLGTDGLAPGLYVLRIGNAADMVVQRFVKLR